uniref:Serine/threonine-protein kinase receptor n=1 Tax=Panagrellus redivivus TaxID=6233 RepID=A0A7E4VZH4_PANRE
MVWTIACILALLCTNFLHVHGFDENDGPADDPNDQFPLPHYYKQYGVRGKNFDIDPERKEPYILCESYNRAECQAKNRSDCITNIKCFPERRSHQLGCMAVLLYNPNLINDSADMEKIVQEPNLKGCWTQDESELRECSAHAECIVDTRHTGSKSTAFKFCCCRTHKCNHVLSYVAEEGPTLNGSNVDSKIERIGDLTSWWFSLCVSLVIGFIAIIIVFIALMYYNHYRKKHGPKNTATNPTEDIPLTTLNRQNKGLPLTYNVHCMVRVGDEVVDLRRTYLLETLSRGRFGVVYLGVIAEKHIAVKLCVKNEVDSWVNEQDIYAVRAMRTHDNICEFISSFEFGGRHWLVTRYYKLGSLYDFLRNRESVMLPESTKIIYGFLSGLAFLHDGQPSKGKPPMVHRDLKSKNVLLRENLTACISDFGLALKFDLGKTPEELTSQSFYQGQQVGTRRYMAPEVLEGATEFTQFAFQQIDVYAAGLVMWEILDRTEICWSGEQADDIGEPKLPYEDETGPMPTIGTMRDVVVMRRIRPVVKERLKNDENASLVVGTMEEMWETEPDGRITSGCARDRIGRIINQLYGPHPKPSHEEVLDAGPEMVALVVNGVLAKDIPSEQEFADVLCAPGPLNLQETIDREEALEKAAEEAAKAAKTAAEAAAHRAAKGDLVPNDVGDDAAALLQRVPR